MSVESQFEAFRSEGVPDAPPLEALRRRTARRRRKRMLGAAVAVLLVAGGTIGALRGDDGKSQVDALDGGPTTTSASTTTSSLPGTSSSEAPSTTVTTALTGAAGLRLPSGQPVTLGEIVVARYINAGGDPGTHELAVVSALDGSITRTFDRFDTSEGGISDIALSADRRTILVTRGTSACTGELVAYPADGASDPVVYPEFANPYRIDISPDGTRLAVSSDDDCDGAPTLRVWPLGQGPAPAWVFGDGGRPLAGLPNDAGGQSGYDPDSPFVVSFAFSDNDTLAYVIRTASDQHDAFRLDIEAGTATPITAPDGSEYRAFVSSGATLFALVAVNGEFEYGQLTEAGLENVIRLQAEPTDVAAVGGDPAWITGDQRLLRFLETSTLELRDDVTTAEG